MKLMRIGEMGEERPCLVDEGGKLRDVSSVVGDYTPDVLAELERHFATVDLTTLPEVDLDGARIGAPIARPHNVLCIGLNYSDHAAETGMAVPEEPIIFTKPSSAIAGPNDDLGQPSHSTKLDLELELGVVIGKAGLGIPKDQALDHVLGYTIVNDVSERNWQIERGGQWSKGKSYPGFCPVGPVLVTADEMPDTSDLAMELKVNDVTQQSGTTATMIFDVPYIVSYLSQFMLLEAGDIICTGTPPGVGLGRNPPEYRQAGDRVQASIAGLGQQSFAIVRV